jgi:AraC-like DNA-binding protein
MSVHDGISGIRFRPGTAGAFLGVPARDIRDQAIALGLLWGQPGDELEARLFSVAEPERASQLLQSALAARLDTGAKLDRAVLKAASRLQHSPASPVQDLAVGVGLSERQLRRRFEREVGLSMKRLGRIVRFQRLLDEVRQRQRRCGALSPNWASMALDFGYADQAHLIRESRALSGVTPTDLAGVTWRHNQA